jgi:hypothetical protein
VTAGLLFLGGAVVIHAVACHSRRSEPEPIRCTPPSDSARLEVAVEQLAGAYRVKLVATSGPKAGQSTDGTLRLQPNDSVLRAVMIAGIRDTSASYVLYGTAGIDLEAVGAVRPGNLASADPQQPGVLVIERKGGITLRLGSEANRRDVVRYDGGYTALRVTEASRDRFAGTWASGLGGQRSGGYFCAVRDNGKDEERPG